MNKRLQNRKSLVVEPSGNQMSIAGFALARPEQGVDAAFKGLLRVNGPVTEVNHPAVIAAKQTPTDQNKHVMRSKAMPEIMRESQAYDVGVNMQRMTFRSFEEGIDKSDTLEAIAARETLSAKGMYAVSDRYGELAERAKESPLNEGRSISMALNQRADVFNNAGIGHDVRSLVAREGIEGVMKQGDLTEDQAFEKIKKVRGTELMNRHFMERSQQLGAEVEGLAAPEEMADLMRKGGPEAGKQMTQLRSAMIKTAYPKDYRGEDRRDYMIKRAALIAHARDIGEGPYDSPAALKLDKEISKTNVSRKHPLMKSFREARAGIQERLDERSVSEDVR